MLPNSQLTGSPLPANELPPSPADMSSTPAKSTGMVLPIIAAVGFSHGMNDLIQATLPAIYPMLKDNFSLSFTQIGLITLVYQLTASILQPAVGHYTDKHPIPYLLPIGMLFTLMGLLLISQVNSFELLLISSAFIGIGSSTFHPEASRVARMASGGHFGFAQSFFQVGGNAGTALGPLLAAAIIIPRGQGGVAWFGIFALLAIAVLQVVSRWYAKNLHRLSSKRGHPSDFHLSQKQVIQALVVLALLIFSKFIYMSSISSYFTFYLIGKFSLTVQEAQMHLFVFLAAVAVGTFAGGPIGDRIGRKYVIWVSILGVTPFTLALPYANETWTWVLSVIIGLILSSAFAAIIVFAQELVPGRVGTISGIFFGLMFGISGIAGAGLGWLADRTSIDLVFKLCAYLPLLGILTILLPDMRKPKKA